MKTRDFDYDLPGEFIAQTPAEPRDSSRLLFLDRQSDRIEHSIFREIGKYLHEEDLIVINETRVIPARLYGYKVPSGGKVEILLLHRIGDMTWEALVGGKGLTGGKRISIPDGPGATVLEVLTGSRRMVQFDFPIEDHLQAIGHVPLPPYIHTPLVEPERYQTVYSRTPGSAAAPTAGLHFTDRLMKELAGLGVRFARIILHVGLDTFMPVTEVQPTDHQIHTEWCQVPGQTIQAVQSARSAGGRIIAVGTTSVRALETAAKSMDAPEGLHEYEGPTGLFILPGHRFKLVDGLITNFHLPRSTLIMLVSAFAGRERILQVYEQAKSNGYRFYSFGDAMFIV